jgi:hypothetical protein
MQYRLDAAKADDLGWIADCEEYYFPADSIPEEKLREWYASNSDGFLIVNKDNAARIGHLVILPLRSNALEAFVRGDLRERELSGKDLHPAGVRTAPNLYVESLGTIESVGSARSVFVKFVLSQLTSVVNRVSTMSMLDRLYAVDATDRGRHLLHDLGFEIVVSGASRPDQHDIYSVPFRKLESRIASLLHSRQRLVSA